ncbi:Replicase polyprotein 1a [Apis cerana cerana]|uniref:Replicase polyprotein 1a n=1 Tax=Apis cerana cerana TaxID=94128 RepID=A0A2A3E3I1_APICC|nr:Replicase polyprotein 1a [Apis cerana cerana]
MPASVKPMHDETSKSVTDQANTETSLGQGIDMIDNSLGNEGNLEYDVCCTLQEYDDKLDVDHVADDGKKMDEDDNGDDNVEVDVDVVTDDIDVVAGRMDDRDIESGNDNKDDDNEDRILCCRCIVWKKINK